MSDVGIMTDCPCDGNPKKLMSQCKVLAATLMLVAGEASAAYGVSIDNFRLFWMAVPALGVVLAVSEKYRRFVYTGILLFVAGYLNVLRVIPSHQVVAEFARKDCGAAVEASSKGELLCAVSGEVASTPQRPVSGRMRFELQLDSHRQARVLIYSGEVPWEQSFDISRGDRVSVTIRATLVRGEQLFLPEPFSYEAFLFRRGVIATGKLLSIQRIQRKHSSGIWESILQDFRSDPKLIETAGVFLAAASGDESLLGMEVAEVFRKAGLYHVLVVSGFHLVVIFGLLFYCLRAIFCRIRWLLYFIPVDIPAAVAAYAISAAYVVFTGAELATQRALYALSLVVIAKICFRKAEVVRAYFVVFMMTLIVFPATFFEAGFQLTFSAVAGLALSSIVIRRSPRLRRLTWGKRAAINVVVVSTGPWLLTMPITLFWFHSLCPFGVLYNVLFGAVFSGVFIVGGGVLLVWKSLGVIGEEGVQTALFFIGNCYLRLLECFVGAVEQSIFRYRQFEAATATALGMVCLAVIGAILVRIALGNVSALAIPRALWQITPDAGFSLINSDGSAKDNSVNLLTRS